MKLQPRDSREKLQVHNKALCCQVNASSTSSVKFDTSDHESILQSDSLNFSIVLDPEFPFCVFHSRRNIQLGFWETIVMIGSGFLFAANMVSMALCKLNKFHDWSFEAISNVSFFFKCIIFPRKDRDPIIPTPFSFHSRCMFPVKSR